MGGRAAEEIFLNHITTGAGNDIERATEIARQMVCEWGMSSLGPLTFGRKEEAIFLGREIAQHRDYSEDTAIKIDVEVRGIVNMGYSRARQILETHSDALERVAPSATGSRSARCDRIEAPDGRQDAAGQDSASVRAACRDQRTTDDAASRASADSRLAKGEKPAPA